MCSLERLTHGKATCAMRTPLVIACDAAAISSLRQSSHLSATAQSVSYSFHSCEFTKLITVLGGKTLLNDLISTKCLLDSLSLHLGHRQGFV